MRRLLFLIATFTAAGCASAPVGKMAWELEREPTPTPTSTSTGDDRLDGPSALSVAPPEVARSRRAATATGYTDADLLAFEAEETYLPPVANPAPEKLAAEAPAGPPIDAALLRFAAEARLRRMVLPHSSSFPPDAIAAWQGLAQELEQYLDRPMPQTPLAELVRARVALEAELDFDRRRFGNPPAEVAAALRQDLTHLARRAEAARALGQTIFVATRPPVLRWPIMDAGLSSTFGPRLHPIDHVRRMHWGVDFAAAIGRVVSSAARGFVVRAGYTPGYGLAVEVRHDGELTSRYGHLSRLLCAPGDRLDAGQPIGLVGSTGRSTGPHLHFEVWRGGRAEDPLVLLGARWSGSAGGGG
jgi:murein DD-endopeptidase MepM/ murein hydrolase activator NlpD